VITTFPDQHPRMLQETFALQATADLP